MGPGKSGVDDLELNFNARLAVPDYAAVVERCRAETAALGRRVAPERNVAYGDHPLETLDWYRGDRGGGPVHVFIHGGYWRAHDKDEFGFVAAPLVARGVHVAVINYPLCPAHTVAEVVDSTIRALAWIHGNGGRFGGDVRDLTLSGHSAGAHLAAMALAHDWEARGLPPTPIRSAVLVSGIFELEPVLGVSINRDEIRLAASMVPELSPMRFPPTGTPLLLPVGGDEAPLWMRQSADFADRVVAAGGKAVYMEIPGCNHFTVIESLKDPRGPLACAMLDHLFPG